MTPNELHNVGTVTKTKTSKRFLVIEINLKQIKIKQILDEKLNIKKLEKLNIINMFEFKN